MTTPNRRLLLAVLASTSLMLLAAGCGSVTIEPLNGSDDPNLASDASEDATTSDAPVNDATAPNGNEDDTDSPPTDTQGPSLQDIGPSGADVAPPEEDTAPPLQDLGPPGADVDTPEEDTAPPNEDITTPEADIEVPLCVAGETACEGDWVVVCAPGGEAWTQIVECSEDSPCFDGTCCSPSCDGLSCGDDGCGGSCGACEEGEVCTDGACDCAPQCDGKDCGEDGCGGVCGECGDGDLCDAGVCLCIPDCSAAMCGGDGCGGSCGACPTDNVCTGGVCVGPCTPGDTRCNVGTIEVCNPDGETWSAIATCAEDTPCFEGSCCTPVCDGVSCGSDGCGGSCGECGDAETCVIGACLPTCDSPGETGCADGHVTLCSPEGLWENLLDCATLAQVCDGGECVEPVIPPLECPEECTGTSIEAALCALDICYADYLVGAELLSPTDSEIEGAYAAIAHYGDAENDLSPTHAPSYFVMASGFVDSDGHKDSLGGGGSAPDPFASDGYDMRDAVELKLVLTAPDGVTGFSLDFIFMSIEYEEWIGSSFNDKFYLILEGTDGASKVINYSECSNPGAYYDFQNDAGKWCYIAINTAFSEPCSDPTTDISGTGFECDEGSSTGWLRTTHPVQGGDAFTLTLHIHDTSDQGFDSAAIIDNFQWMAGEVIHETIPIAQAGCVAECGDNVCGWDGCGGICGLCAGDEYCDPDGQCQDACAPSCEGKSCGPDGCGGSCGTCDEDELCDDAGQCVSDPVGCEDPNPAGCEQNGCPDGSLCVPTPEGECVASTCGCDLTTGTWACTEDCGGGVCELTNSDATGIRIELFWDTPSDPDQTDTGPGSGADLDLHFTHPFAVGDDGLGWFDSPFDCFWYNPNPNWGSLNSQVDDDPEVLLDDINGSGPEIIKLSIPQDGMVYRVGAHYWNDHGFEMSLASLKIWINGELVSELPGADDPGVAMITHDMWEAATIAWPSGVVTPLTTANGGHVILSDYPPPFLPGP